MRTKQNGARGAGRAVPKDVSSSWGGREGLLFYTRGDYIGALALFMRAQKMKSGNRRPRRRVPYRQIRLPLETILRRFEDGDRLRREHRESSRVTEASIYERRGLLSVG